MVLMVEIFGFLGQVTYEGQLFNVFKYGLEKGGVL
jgi:hypothetical protein